MFFEAQEPKGTPAYIQRLCLLASQNSVEAGSAARVLKFVIIEPQSEGIIRFKLPYDARVYAVPKYTKSTDPAKKGK